ncbi:hypothetical protein ACIBL5_31230 [Streptomyces sp. NPDC050516]|uniref:hypothetical protein n=1 Tax=Streptomyces sp. NPDC050516 TaxID=3365621 RepID=UPI0037A5BE19
MGVFSRFRRKADAAVAESTEEVKAATPTAEPETGGGTDTAADGPAAEASEVSEASQAAEETEAAEPAEPAAAEGVEIPKQQSAEEAADSEAGEGARK